MDISTLGINSFSVSVASIVVLLGGRVVMKKVTFLLIIVSLILLNKNVVFATDLSKFNRESLLMVVFSVCPESLPSSIKRQFSDEKITLFCSCYSSGVADQFTEEEFQRLALSAKKHKKSFAIPRALGVSASRGCSYYFE